MVEITAEERYGEINRLVAVRRKELDTDFITDHDKIDDDGDKIREIKESGPTGNTRTKERNLTHLLQSAPSVTGNVEILRLEAEMMAEGRELDNPHIPVDESTLEQATESIAQDGHSPAWEA